MGQARGVISVFVSGVLAVMLLAGAVLAVSASRNRWEREEVEGASGLRDLSGEFQRGEAAAWFRGRRVVPPVAEWDEAEGELAEVLGAVAEEKWIEVDLSEQKLVAHEGERVFLETLVSSGKWAPTPTGEFRIWIKLRYAKMEGGKPGTSTYYYLPNVPYIMYFENEKIPGWRGYGLHGTYWHNNFGQPMSHGCVNLPTGAAEKLYYWVHPVLGEKKNMVRATEEDPGTRLVIHE